MEDRIDVNDRRGLKRQADSNRSYSSLSEHSFQKPDQVNDIKEEAIKRLKSCSASPKQDKGEIQKVESASISCNIAAPSVGMKDDMCVVGQTEDVSDENNDNPGDDRVSEISGISDVSASGTGRWHPVSRAMLFVRRQMSLGCDPRAVLRTLLPHEADSDIPDDLDDMTLWRLIISLVSGPPRRHRLVTVSTLDDVVRLLQTCTKVIVLTGAGVSVSCGIPDFRSANGIYSRLAVDYPDLPNPQAMFDIAYFRKNPRPFFQFAKEIYPGQFTPSPSHRFIHYLEVQGKLLRNYTQNIDTLEQSAGISRVVQCHGSFATATCMVCRHHVDSDAIRDDVLNQIIPMCPRCGSDNAAAILKPDIVFFGESLPEDFHRHIQMDKDECDLLIVIGSSLKVQPVALIPSSLPDHVPQILINREPLRHIGFDVELLGDCDVIVNELFHRLGGEWKTMCTTAEPAVETDRDINTASVPAGQPALDKLREEEHICSDGHDSLLGLQSESDDANVSDNHTKDELVQPTEPNGLSNKTESAGSAIEWGHRRRQDSAGSVDRHRHMLDSRSTAAERHRVRRNSVSVLVHDGRSGQSSVETQSKLAHDKGNVVSGAEENTVDNVTERNKVLETIQRHDQDVNRDTSSQPINWASMLTGNNFIHLGLRRYIFSGAEVSGEMEDSSSGEDDDNSMSSSFGDEDSEDSDGADEEQVADVVHPSLSVTPVDLANVESSDGSVDP